MRTVNALGLCAILGLGLAACSDSKPVECPSATIIPGAQSVAKFGAGPGREAQDIDYGARLLNAALSCEWGDDEKGVAVSTKLGVSVLRGKPEIRTGQLVYFVAVTDRRQNILTERDFTIDLKFPEAQSRLEITEEHDEFIPLPKGGSGANYGVLFGFRLTPEELQYNRDHEKRDEGSKTDKTDKTEQLPKPGS